MTGADWCSGDGSVVICGTRMVEHSRTPDGEPRWCFHCRKVQPFEVVISVPDGESYYGPSGTVECPAGHDDGDLFPGRYREWSDG